MRRTASLLLWVLAAMASMPESAAACSCGPLGEPCEALWSSDGTPDDVFEATVASVEERPVPASPAGASAAGAGQTRIVISLIDVRSRLGRTATEVFTERGTCGVSLTVGRRYLIHTRIRAGAWVHLCSYTRRIESSGTVLAFLDGLDRDGPGAQVTGRVTLPTEEPVLDDPARPLSGVEVQLDGDAKRTAITDAGGRFAFTGLAPGRYTVAASEDDARALVPKHSEAFTLPHAHACRAITLAMGLTSLIEGVLRDKAGQPVPGMAVTLKAHGLPRGPVRGSSRNGDPATRDPFRALDSTRDLTSASGRFSFRGVPPGRYVVGVNVDAAPEDGPLAPVFLSNDKGEPLVVELGLGEHLDVHTLRLPHARVPLTGTVVTPDGRPAGGIVVSAQAQGGQSWMPEYLYMTTGDDGRFSLPLAPGPRYRLVADSTAHAKGLDVAAGSGPVTLVVQPRR